MASKFIKVLEQATDSTLVESNWEGIITCTDMIRSGEVPAKPALQAIRKRLQHENPHVVSHTLLLLDACVKNCGHKMHTEIATREFMEDFKNLVTDNRYDEVKNKSLEMLQCWATAFANKPEYKMIVDTHNLMKLAGYDFPSLKEADAMFMAQVAPEWQDGDVCYRCRSTFSFLTRKHHCRACGQIFCDKCSSKEMALPQYGIEKEVRVCETCFESKQSENYQREKDKFLTSKVGQFISSKNNDIGLSSSKEVSQEEKEKLLREKEEEDLALALAISQSEAEAKQQEKAKNLYSLYNGTLETTNSPEQRTNPIDGYKGAAELTSSTPPFTESSDDPLAKYLNRDYWQQKKEAKSDEWTNSPAISATAPPPSEPSVAPSICSTLMAPDDNSLNAELAAMSFNGVTNGGISIVGEEIKAHSDETLKWCQSIREQVSVMDNRIKSNLARGRPVFNDSAIQDLFTRLTELHAHVLSRMHTLDEQRGYYESLQDHLANISEARQAINELREEHERKRQERLAEEQRLRQAQMQQTLEMMRMKKHAMLMEQREQALQRFQQQQQEMAMRRQQQQHQFSYYNVPGYSVQQNIVPQYGYHDNQIPNSQQYYQNAPAPVPPLVSSHNVVSGNQYPAQGQNGYQYYPQHQQQQQHMYPQQHNYQQQQQPQNYSNGMNEQPVAQDQQAHSYGQQQVSQHIEQNSHQIDTNQQQSNGQQVVEQPLISFD